MNNPLEPSPRLTWRDPRGEDSAEAAQRDLFEFLATLETPAQSEVLAPPLAADAALLADVAPPSIPDPPDAADERSGAAPGAQACPAREGELGEARPAASERAARSSAQAVDEATQENLRRLEATVSRVQKGVQALRLPRAVQIAPVRGVPSVEAPWASSPAFDAIIDRSSLRRTVHGSTMPGATMSGATEHGSPPLPIWLREHEAPIKLPAPRRGNGLWQRLVKFFWACAVAAPIAYVFAITTSPLHRHLFDVEGLRSAILVSLSALQPTQYTPASGRDLIAIAPTAPSDDSASVATAGMQLAAIPSGVAVAPPVAVETERAGAAAAQAVATVASLPDADRTGTPDAAPASPGQPVIATGAVGETQANAVPAPTEAGAAATSAGRQDVSGLMEEGKRFFDMGDLVAARILFTRAAKAGDAAAAVAMATTYDPVALAGRGIRGVVADPEKALAWYERARDMGSSEGPRRLEVSSNR